MTIARVGSGTQRIEAELSELLAPLQVFRLDSDSAGSGAHGELLRRFDAGDLRRAGRHPDGRQGPRLPRGHPRRRARRRRDAAPARLPLRGADLRPDHPARRAQRPRRGAAAACWCRRSPTGAPSIRRAARHDAAGFLAEELERRRALRYPPFSHLIELTLASAEEERAGGGRGRAGASWSPSGSRRRPSCSARRPLFRLRGQAPPPPARQVRSTRSVGRRGARRGCGGGVAVAAARRGGLGRRRSAVAPRLDSRHGRGNGRPPPEIADEDEAPIEIDGARGPRRGGARAPRAALAQVVKFGDPVLRSAASPVTDVRPGAGGRRRAHGRADARRDGRRAWRRPSSASCGASRLPGRGPTPAHAPSSTRRSSGPRRTCDRRGGLPQPARGRRRRRAAAARPGPRRSTPAGDPCDRGLRARGAGAPARDRPPRRRPDDRPHRDASSAAGRCARCARAGPSLRAAGGGRATRTRGRASESAGR